MTPLLSTRRLEVAIAGHVVVRDLDLELNAGERLVILGRNGVGKTTLLHALAGLGPVVKGDIALLGKPYAAHGLRGAARLRGVLPQHQADAFDAGVLQSVLAGRHPHLSRWSWETADDVRIAQDALDSAGLSALAERALHTLSGGERQRVAIATLLAQQPRLYFLDEPLAHLDLSHQIMTLRVFSSLARDRHAALVTVLHDINLAASHADLALLLYGEGRFELGTARAMLTAERLGPLYGHPLRELNDGERRWLVPEDV